MTDEESHTLHDTMEQFLTDTTRPGFEHDRRSSIHEIPGQTAHQAMQIYEPAGRLEVPNIPAAAEDLLQKAFDRSRTTLARLLPSVSSCRPWTYVEYGPRQHITPHLDCIAPDPHQWPRQIAGISVTIGPRCSGGEFFVETTSDERLWEPATSGPVVGYEDGMSFAHDGADNSSPWFAEMARTRWSVEPARGTALLYGSQLAHGTCPVTDGRMRKFISWLFADAA
ncbi:hypothetical protein ACQPW1_22540 [Nocardia sp. CA-128927]|uniref:hypothetical protein n=1 Tax=Nocardia sp. CA-128927 TaxID=3239975 RepID=UPI003D993566